MIHQSIEIRNFGPISNANVTISRLTIFIGDQGTGKSTISKLLTICQDTRWWWCILKNDQEHIWLPFKEFSIDEYFREDSYFCFFVRSGDEKEWDYCVKFENGIFSCRANGIEDERFKNALAVFVSNTAIELLEQYGLSIDKLDSIDSNTKSLLRSYLRMCLYIPTERNLVGTIQGSLASMITRHIPISFVILEFIGVFEKASKEFTEYDASFLNARYVEDQGRRQIRLTGCDKTISLSECSSGLRSTLPMLMVIDYSLKKDYSSWFVVEEPEQNLFPKNQRELLHYFASKINGAPRCGFVLTTHSPYLLSCLNVQMLAYGLHNSENLDSAVKEIIPKEFAINPQDVAVYSLGGDENAENYCRSLISEKTGLISVNELDSVSENIGDDFDRLYSLYLKTKKK